MKHLGPAVEIELVSIPAGAFAYGPERQPRSLAAFAIGKRVVTRAQYRAFCAATGPFHDDDDGPAYGMSWHDADAFCRRAGADPPT